MDINQIVEERTIQKLERIGPHSHINGLGLNQKLEPILVVR